MYYSNQPYTKLTGPSRKLLIHIFDQLLSSTMLHASEKSMSFEGCSNLGNCLGPSEFETTRIGGAAPRLRTPTGTAYIYIA